MRVVCPQLWLASRSGHYHVEARKGSLVYCMLAVHDKKHTASSPAWHIIMLQWASSRDGGIYHLTSEREREMLGWSDLQQDDSDSHFLSQILSLIYSQRGTHNEDEISCRNSSWEHKLEPKTSFVMKRLYTNATDLRYCNKTRINSPPKLVYSVKYPNTSSSVWNKLFDQCLAWFCFIVWSDTNTQIA